MSGPQPKRIRGELEITEDLAFQRRSWRWERIGQGLVLLLVLLALAGLFGGGPLSRATVTGPDGMRVEYPRFVRNQSHYELRVSVPRASDPASAVRLSVAASLLDGLQVDAITPEPARMELARDRIWFEFTVTPAEHPGAIVFHSRANGIGIQHGDVALAGGDRVPVRSFIYP